MSYKHIKLDKIVAGTEQRIFKTKILNIPDSEVDQTTSGEINVGIVHDVSDQVKYHEFNTVFYGEYSSELKTTSKINGNSIYDGNLLHFNEVNSDYITNRPEERYTTSSLLDVSIYNTSFPNWFKIRTIDYQKDEEKMKDERVTYFPKHLDMPIDISLSEGRAYMLSPLNTERYTNLVQCSANIVYKTYGMKATYKPNYANSFSEFMSKSFYYAEDNAVPIYDMSFSTFQTINLGNHENAIKWLEKWNLTRDEISSQIIFDSETNISGINAKDSYNSILVQELLEQLEFGEFNYLYSSSTIRDILYDLFARIDVNSILRMIQPFGSITKVRDNVVSDYLTNKVLSSDFKIQQEFIDRAFNEKQENTFLTNSLPHNAIFITNTSEQLNFYRTADNSIKSKLSDALAAENPPSAYLDFMYLKNNQNPHYDYDLNVDMPEISLDTFKIYTDTKGYVNDTSDNPMSSYVKPYDNDQSDEFNEKYDFDGTTSIQFNSDSKYNIVTNKARTNDILQYGSEKDEECAKSDFSYAENYQVRLKRKIPDYMSVFTHRHISTNKIYNVGEVLGLRNYIHTGQITGTGKIWLSYKYAVTYDQLFMDSFAETYIPPFKVYNLQRYENHMEQLIPGMVQYEGESNIKYMKQAGLQCPYRVTGEDFQQMVGCSLPVSSSCKGYCPFPTYGQCGVYGNKQYANEYYPEGVTWTFSEYKEAKDIIEDSLSGFDKINNEWFVMQAPTNLSEELVLETTTDIDVADDIEIYFVNKDFGNSDESIEETLQHFKDELSAYTALRFKSLYQGFGGYIDNGYVTYPEYILTKSDLVSAHVMSELRPASSYFTSLKQYVIKMKDKTNNTNMAEFLSAAYLSDLLSSYLDMTSGDFVYDDEFTKNNLKAFTTMLNNLTYSDVLLNYSKNKELSSFLFHTISEFENEGNTIVSAIIDEKIVSSTLADIYTTNIGEFIIDQISAYPLKDQIFNKNLLYNNFVISETSPFNGPHTIPNGSVISAYKITGSNGKIKKISENKMDYLTKNDMVVMRIKNWWSNTAYCSGQMKIRQKDPITIETYKDNPLFPKLFNTISNFDHVERVKGLFKYQQNDIKKSNIYSLRLTNSGLNPANDISEDVYTPFKYLLEDDFYKLSSTERSLYTSYYWNDIKLYHNAWINELITCIVNNNSIGINNKDDFELHMSIQLNQNAKIFVFDTEKSNKLNATREELRQIIEEAIRTSVKRYMPVHTNLWKIMYSGK